MATYQLNVNGQRKQVNVDPSTPLLWILREELKLTGTKYGCGISACGACTVHVDGIATRSCVVPVSLVGDRPIVTIEGVGRSHRPGGAGCLDRKGRSSMRLLSKRTDYERRGVAESYAKTDGHEY